ALAERRRNPLIGEDAHQDVQAQPNDVTTFCVFVIVADDEGAKGFATAQVALAKRELDLTGPVRTYRNQEITFTAAYKGEPEATAEAVYRWATGADCQEALNQAH